MNVIFLGCGGCSGLLSIDVLDDLRDRVASEEAVEPLLLHSYIIIANIIIIYSQGQLY